MSCGHGVSSSPCCPPLCWWDCQDVRLRGACVWNGSHFCLQLLLQVFLWRACLGISTHPQWHLGTEPSVYIFNKYSDEKAWVSFWSHFFADDVCHYCNIVTIAPVVSFFWTLCGNMLLCQNLNALCLMLKIQTPWKMGKCLFEKSNSSLSLLAKGGSPPKQLFMFTSFFFLFSKTKFLFVT